MLIVPPLPAIPIFDPSGIAPHTFVKGIAIALLLVLEDMVAVTMATIPLLKAVEFIPVARQVSAPLPATQLSVLPAAVKTGPAVAFSVVILFAGYAIVHCNPAGAVTVPDSERFKESELPLVAAPDARANV